ncbi:MAG: hypothetical protein FJ245_10640 [Nitrospira sp.]|nr:hypothetical protein [Nitrospira sp.]
MLPMNVNAFRKAMRRAGSFLLTISLIWAGCASSGDVEKARQEQAQAKAKMSAELQQERQLAASMHQESEAQKAEAEKLAKALGGTAQPKPQMAAPLRGTASSITLTQAMTNYNNGHCQKVIKANPPVVPQQVTALHIASSTECPSVTISTTDTTPFTAASPLIPVVVGSGGTLTLNDPGTGNTMTLYASSFLIQNTGTMSAGSATAPVAGQITIVMAGNASAALPPTTGDQNQNMRDITVMDGGTLALYGGKGLSAAPGTMNNDIVSGTQSWTYLAVPAGPSSLYGENGSIGNVSAPVPTQSPDGTLLTLATNVQSVTPPQQAWQVDDWISVATTSFSSHQTEIVQICSIQTVSNPESGSITSLSNGSPIVVTSTFTPANGAQVTITGTGTSADNQTYTVTTSSYNTFSLNGSTGSQLSTSGQWTLAKQVSQITLCQPLKHYHYGGFAPTPGFFPASTTQKVVSGGNPINVSHQAKSFYDDHHRNYGIDERAEVALLSRNIKLTSVAGQTGDGNNFIGGHLVAMVSQTGSPPSPTLTLSGVEVEKFGQGLVGRYPVHLHMLPSGSGVWVQDVSVHHSYNKCYVVHGTGNANFYNNVCVRTVGQGFYLEDGDNITGNQFMRNHIAGTMAANTQYSFPLPPGSLYWDGDNLQNSHLSWVNWYNVNSIPDTSQSGYNASSPEGPDLYQPSGFWITNLGNTFVNNSVAGCQANGRGYWLIAQGANGTAAASRFTYPEFTGNRAHGCYYGIDVTAQDGVSTDNTYTNDPRPTLSTTGVITPPVFLLNDNTITRSRFRGFWSRSLFTALHNNRFATNPYGFSLLGGGGPEGNNPDFWGMAHENVIAGMTRNNVERFPACTPPITKAWNNTGGGSLNVESPIIPQQGASILISGVQGYSSANSGWTVGTTTANSFTTTAAVNKGSSTNSGVWQYTSGWTYGKVMVPWRSECADVALSSSGANLGWGNHPTTSFGSVINVQGYSYYDGPARIEHNRFVNFRFDPTGIYPTHPEARLLTRTDMQTIVAFDSQTQGGFPVGPLGQLQGIPQLSGTNTTLYNGYVGDAATGWIQSNAQSVPPTQYIRDSIWENVDFKHQVYTEEVNIGKLNDGDKTTVILDKDSQLSGLRVDGTSPYASDFAPVSLNNLDYYATDYTVDEPHSRGPNNFRSSSLMSPHKYATLNVESDVPTPKFVKIVRDMPAYGDTDYPSLFLYGRGGTYIYEPFVMDRMGYTVYAETTSSAEHGTQTYQGFENHLLFTYTDPAVKTAGDFFVNRIAVYQPLQTPNQWQNIKVYRVRRQWGQYYYNTQSWPPNYIPPISSNPNVYPAIAPACDLPYFDAGANWADCLNRATNKAPYNAPPYYTSGTSPYQFGIQLQAAAGTTAEEQWTNFEATYKTLMTSNQKPSDIATFIANQTFFYDTTTSMLYFYMIEDSPVQKGYEPFGTCSGDTNQYAANVQAVQTKKNFSDPGSVQRALDASCLVSGGAPQPIDLFTCGEIGCAAYMVDFSGLSATGTFTTAPSTGHPIKRTDYAGWNQYSFVYATPSQQPNGLPVAANAAIGNTAPPPDGASLTGVMASIDNVSPSTGSGDQLTYWYIPHGSGTNQTTDNFPYHCVTTPPWSPVNARVPYLSSGGFTYPLHDSVCDWVMPHPIVGVTGGGVITSVSANTPNTLILPPVGAQVVISGIAGLAGPYTVSNPTANTFSIGTTYSGTYTGGGTWQILNSIAGVTNTASSVTLTVQTGAPVPGAGTLVALSGISVCTLPGTLTVASSTPSTKTTGGTFTIDGTITGSCTATNATWQWQPPLSQHQQKISQPKQTSRKTK